MTSERRGPGGARSGRRCPAHPGGTIEAPLLQELPAPGQQGSRSPGSPRCCAPSSSSPTPRAIVARNGPQTIDTLAKKLKRAAERLDARFADLLASPPTNKSVWKTIWSNDPQERLDEGVRAAGRHHGHLPSGLHGSAWSGPLLAEQERDEWAGQHRYMGLEVLAACRAVATHTIEGNQMPDTTARTLAA